MAMTDLHAACRAALDMVRDVSTPAFVAYVDGVLTRHEDVALGSATPPWRVEPLRPSPGSRHVWICKCGRADCPEVGSVAALLGVAP